MNRSSASFTLIELLVVIAIISILAALLAPGLKTARDSARKAACLSQLKQVSQAMLMYVNDNNGFLPIIWEGGLQQNLWVYKLWPTYLGNKKDILICPSELARVNVLGSSWSTWSLLTYGVNYYAFNPPSFQTVFPGASYLGLSQLTQPARTIMVGDSKAAFMTFDNTTPWYPFANRHLGGANMTFMDGHASWVPTTGLIVNIFQSGNPWSP